jgi:hypothetical protein
MQSDGRDESISTLRWAALRPRRSSIVIAAFRHEVIRVKSRAVVQLGISFVFCCVLHVSRAFPARRVVGNEKTAMLQLGVSEPQRVGNDR